MFAGGHGEGRDRRRRASSSAVSDRLRYRSFRPGQVWLDTGGNRIQAHGGSIHHDSGVFYWYGENKERTTPDSGIWHWGIRCYRSTDLYNWEDLGLIIPPEPDEPSSPLHPAQKVDRPHIVQDPSTGRYVCWLKLMGDGVDQSFTVLVADSLLGPYSLVRTGLQPLGVPSGDFDLVVDPDSGQGYCYFERVHSELICVELTPDLTDVTERHSVHFPRPHPPDVREAPAHFERGGRHYLATSGTTAYFPNPTEVAVGHGHHGPFDVLGHLHAGDRYGTSFRSQISSVFAHPAHDDLYIALADRWLPNLPEESSNQTEMFRSLYTGATTVEEVARDAPELVGLAVDADTSIADYVWLPIRFDGDTPTIEWFDEWTIEGVAGIDSVSTAGA